LKTRNKNINVRELFKEKLEFAEVMPDAGVRSKLMRRVARKEFLRFNPLKLNIFYLGGILLTGITAAVLLYHGSENSDLFSAPGTMSDLHISDTSNYVEVPVKQPIRVQPLNSATETGKSEKNALKVQPQGKTDVQPSKEPESGKKNTSIPSTVTNSFSNNSIFPDSKTDKKKLQGGLTAEAFLIDPASSEGCAPLKVRFHNNSPSYDSCRWSFGDGGYSDAKDPEWIFDLEGEYKVVLEVYHHDGMILLSAATVTVHPKPQAHFEISPEKAVIPDDEIRFMNYSTNAVKCKWDFGDGTTSESFEPRHSYAKFGNYNVRLVVFSDLGCSDSLTVINAFSRSDHSIGFPNAFIPNRQGPSGGYYSSKSDEGAQVFHPSYTEVSEYQMKIFSKLGIVIFESNDINIGWDGYNDGQLCEPGVYIWKVRGKFRNGEPFIKMGDITLLNN
jgi:PKD repeat protein